ncbi:MAG TPA: hypothetical protein VL688_01010 [Verrucomicrobiae bacterium]|jgi:hypothetical protein|nr:hypothetical protein [Verrucomicrobiae bacterium]
MKEMMMLVWALSILMTFGSMGYATDDDARGTPKPINEVSSLTDGDVGGSGNSFFESQESMTDGQTGTSSTDGTVVP